MSPEQRALAVILATGAILMLSALGGAVARKVGQPAVVGQLFMGILASPTALGGLILGHGLLSGKTLGSVTTFSQLGLVLFMFSVGYEIDFPLLRRSPRAIGLVCLGGMLLPMVLGSGLG